MGRKSKYGVLRKEYSGIGYSQSLIGGCCKAAFTLFVLTL